MGEEGTGYLFLLNGEEPAEGDFSAQTRGYLQGYDFAAEGDLDERFEVIASASGEPLAYLRDGAALTAQERYALVVCGGYRPDELIYAGLLKVV